MKETFDDWLIFDEVFPVDYEKRDEEDAEIARLLNEQERY